MRSKFSVLFLNENPYDFIINSKTRTVRISAPIIWKKKIVLVMMKIEEGVIYPSNEVEEKAFINTCFIF